MDEALSKILKEVVQPRNQGQKAVVGLACDARLARLPTVLNSFDEAEREHDHTGSISTWLDNARRLLKLSELDENLAEF
jgi:hypothetical protein